MSYKTYNNYKDSNIDWIKEIPSNWSISRVKNISLIKSGESPKFDDNGQYDVIGANGKIGKTNRFNISTNHIIIGRVGASGSVNISPDFAFISDNAFILTLNKHVDLKYSFYLFKALDMDRLINKNAQPLLTATQIKNLFIPQTTLNEQKQIANYLDKKTAKIDATIAKNEELIRLLEEKRVALINQLVTKGLNPDVAMKDSGIDWIGEIPEHWDITKVKHELDFLDHKRIPLSAEVRSDMDRIYDYYGASGVIDKVDSYLFNGKYILVGEDGANLLSRSTPLAFIAEGKFWVNNHAHILNPKDENNIDYFVSLLEAVDYTPFIEGSAQPKLTADNLKNIILIKPPLVEQNEIAKFLNLKLNHNNHTLSKIQENINLLEEYKTSLIHHVVTGKVDVRGEEI